MSPPPILILLTRFLAIPELRTTRSWMEAELVWEAIPALSLLAHYAYTQAEVTEDNSIPVGDGLSRVPRHSDRFAARSRILNGSAKGLAFGAGFTAHSARELTLPNTVSVPGYAFLDAQTSCDFDRYTDSVSGVNLKGRKVYEINTSARLWYCPLSRARRTSP